MMGSMTEPASDAPSDAASGEIRLDHFLKRYVSGTGGQAKLLIQSGDVRVNGQAETRRRRKLVAGDVVECQGGQWQVGADG